MPIRCLVLFCLFALPLAAEEGKSDPVRVPALLDLKNAKCPVSGEEIKPEKAAHLDWNGLRVHFCCEKCVDPFKKDPAAGLAKLGYKTEGEGDKMVVDLGNSSCPIMGKPVKKDASAVIGSVRVFFCCEGCPKKFQKDLVKGFAGMGFAYTPAYVDLKNKTCPISGEETHEGEAAVFADFDGIRVQFCCDDCIGAFKKDPAAGFAKLGVDPAKLKETAK